MKKVFGALPTRYARSLFLAAKEGNVVNEVEQNLQTLEATLTEYGELAALLLNPGLSAAKKRGILNSLSSKLNFHPVTRKFIELLEDKGRLELLSTIPLYYHRLYLDDAGQVEVTVTTAVAADETTQQKIQSYLKAQSGKEPLITWQQNKEILGGLIVDWPDRVYDASLSRKLRELEKRMVEAV